MKAANRFYHAHGGYTIGNAEMSGGVRNIRVDNCTFMGTDVGLRFKSMRGRGGVVEDIHVSNIRMAGILGDAINFNLYYDGKSALEKTAGQAPAAMPPVTVATPQFRDIHIENVICRGAQLPSCWKGGNAHPGCFFEGCFLLRRRKAFSVDGRRRNSF